MKFLMLAALMFLCGGTAAHSGCSVLTCPPGERQQGAGITLERRIENAFKDLEVINAYAFKPDNLQATEATLTRIIENALKDVDAATARALKADPKRLDELLRKSGIER